MLSGPMLREIRSTITTFCRDAALTPVVLQKVSAPDRQGHSVRAGKDVPCLCVRQRQRDVLHPVEPQEHVAN